MHMLHLLWAAHNETLRQRRYPSRQRMKNIDKMPEALFREHFRLSKALFRKLCEDLRASTAIRGTVEVKVLSALSFFATGTCQRIVGVTQHLTQRTASRCITEVVDAINHNSIIKKWIVFPQTPQERSQIRQEFQRRHNLPGIIGCIDCTHIAIVKPVDNEHLYYNRKGYHSLNVQMVCNQNLEIVNVNSKFGGATHDSYIWSMSQVEPYMRELHQSGEHVWLPGDSGYPQLPWLMTPIFDAALGSQARNCIERCFGLLKSRWRCLKDRVLHYQPLDASRITLACCVLHNIAVKAQLPTEESSEDYSEPTTSNYGSKTELIQGRAMLNHLISRL